MAHFAKLGINGKVIGVHVVDNKDLHNADGIEDEEIGRQYLERIHHWPLWVQTSYNTRHNKHSSIFVPKKPYPSWVLNTSEARWQSPVGDAPELSEEERNTHKYEWDEDNGSWNKVEI
jgi:hypothetical protein